LNIIIANLQKRALQQEAATNVSSSMQNVGKAIYTIPVVAEYIEDIHEMFEAKEPQNVYEARQLFDEGDSRPNLSFSTPRVPANKFFDIKAGAGIPVQEINRDKNIKTGASFIFKNFDYVFFVDNTGACTEALETAGYTSEAALGGWLDNKFYGEPDQPAKLDRNTRHIFGYGYTSTAGVAEDAHHIQDLMTEIDNVYQEILDSGNQQVIDRVEKFRQEKVLSKADEFMEGTYLFDDNGPLGGEFNKKFEQFKNYGADYLINKFANILDVMNKYRSVC